MLRGETSLVAKHGGEDLRAESGSACRLTRREFLKVGGAMVGVSCVPFSLGCAGRWYSSSDAESGGATLRGPAGLWYEDNNMERAGGMSPDARGVGKPCSGYPSVFRTTPSKSARFGTR